MYYRVYPIGPDGHYLPPIGLDCATDDAALAALAVMDPPLTGACELWQLDRFLGRYRFGPGGRVERED